MELNSIKRVYLIGIGGIGMSGLARYFNKRGCLVCGYDRTQTILTRKLEEEGIDISFNDSRAEIPSSFQSPDDDVLIIYTPAIPKTSSIYNHFLRKDFILRKRSEVLGILSKGMFTIAIAGTHGKTTTSTLIAHILKRSGNDCTAFLGGIASNYETNVLFGDSNVMVVEADEYDRSFLTLHPDIAIITAMDADHLDIYGSADHVTESFKLFASQLKDNGRLIRKKGLPLYSGIDYSVTERADAYAENISIINGSFYFDFLNETTAIRGIPMLLPGRHNIENAVAAIQAALYLGVSADDIKVSLASFKGVKRRFEYIVKTNETVYIDDYAHHPEELKACISAIKELYPNRELTVIFQPHLYSRTRDFLLEFSSVLGMCDELILLDIYPARELPIAGVTSSLIFDNVKLTKKVLVSKNEVISLVREKKPEVLLTVGAGDIDTLVKPLKQLLENV